MAPTAVFRARTDLAVRVLIDTTDSEHLIQAFEDFLDSVQHLVGLWDRWWCERQAVGGVSVKRSAAATAPSTGVPEALGALFDREYEPMYRLAFTMLGTDRDAEEVVQDAFVGVASRWQSLDNPGGYLRVSVVNGARKRMRTQIRRTTAEAELRASTQEASWDSGDYLLDLVDGLPDRQRVVVILTYYAGLNSTEVGELLDCPPGTVRSLAHRALTQLREQVTP